MLFLKTYGYTYNHKFILEQELNIIVSDSTLLNKYKKSRKLYKTEKYFKSLEQSLKLIQEAKKKQELEIEFLATSSVGDIFIKTNDYKQAVKYYNKALKLLDRTPFNDKKVRLINKKEKYARALLGIGSSFLRMNNIDDAKFYFEKITKIESLTPEFETIKAKAYVNLSTILINTNKLKEAENYLKLAISIHRKNNNKAFEASALNNLASIYLLNQDYPKAKATYFKGLNLINKNKSINATKFKEELYFNLAWTLYLLKDYRAYDYQEKSYNIKDSLRDSEVRKMIAKIHAQSQLDIEKEKTNYIKQQTKLIEAKDYKMTWLFAALSLLIIIASGVVIYNYKLRQNNLQLKLSENNLLQQQSIEKLKSDAQIKILNATIDAKENERKQIAETLHDNVSALLSSANMHLRASKKQFGDTQPQEIEKTQTIILEASQKVRDLSHNLVSSILLKFGLEYALKDIAKKYSNSELTFDVNALNINRYNQEFEIKIFNVIQELINNIIKHSKANQAKIAITEKENQLTILVKDDGVGFTTSSSSLKDGIGLNQIEARVQVMNGKLNIYSEPNKGTEVIIIVPIQQQKKSFTLTSVS